LHSHCWVISATVTSKRWLMAALDSWKAAELGGAIIGGSNGWSQLRDSTAPFRKGIGTFLRWGIHDAVYTGWVFGILFRICGWERYSPLCLLIPPNKMPSEESWNNFSSSPSARTCLISALREDCRAMTRAWSSAWYVTIVMTAPKFGSTC